MLALLTAFLPGWAIKVVTAFTGTAGKYLLIGAALVIWTLYSQHVGAVKARAECSAAALRIEVAELKRQMEVYQKIAKEEETKAEDRQKELDQAEVEKNAAVEAAKKSAQQQCVIDKSVTDRLRNIR